MLFTSLNDVGNSLVRRSLHNSMEIFRWGRIRPSKYYWTPSGAFAMRLPFGILSYGPTLTGIPFCSNPFCKIRIMLSLHVTELDCVIPSDSIVIFPVCFTVVIPASFNIAVINLWNWSLVTNGASGVFFIVSVPTCSVVVSNVSFGFSFCELIMFV